MTLPRRPEIPSGMYAFCDPLRDAWRRLLQGLPVILGDARNGDAGRARVTFDTSDRAYRSDSMLIGHTCGYPYIIKWRDSHVPVAVPVFDLPGCRGHEYSSWFVCRASDDRDELGRFAGAVVAVNHQDSNSGMNVLRHAISGVASGQRFFSNVLVSGSHLASMAMVARGQADIAAIDAVTLHYVRALDPSHCDGLRVIGQSVSTPGLPFIMHRQSRTDPARLVEALNRALRDVGPEVRSLLCLTEFRPAADSDYDLLDQLRREAIRAGYPTLM